MSARKGRARRAARRGFTLVELMVTVVLLAVGLTGVVATSSAVTRMMGGSIRETAAASLAASRFETLRGSPCASIVAGTATTRGITEKWVVSVSNVRYYDVTDSVSYVPMGRVATVKKAFRSYIRC